MSIQHYVSQPPEKDARSLTAFQNALRLDGFDVNAGATTVINPVASWCAGTPPPGYDNALYANNQPYLQMLVPKSAQDPNLSGNFQLGPQEAIVLVGLTPPPEKYGSAQESDGAQAGRAFGMGSFPVHSAVCETTN